MDAQLLFEQREAQIGHLPAQILLDLARNEAAPREWRKAATQFLMDGNHPQAHHVDLVSLVMEINAEHQAKDEVQTIVESATEESFPALRASVTTASLQRDDAINNIVRNPDALGDDALNDNQGELFDKPKDKPPYLKRFGF
jgi:hypothetical protein